MSAAGDADARAPAKVPNPPTRGRVLFIRVGGPDDAPVLRPAIVTRDADEALRVNVQLFCDGANDIREPLVRRNHLDPYHGQWITDVEPGDGVGEWSWPPHVTPPKK